MKKTIPQTFCEKVSFWGYFYTSLLHIFVSVIFWQKLCPHWSSGLELRDLPQRALSSLNSTHALTHTPTWSEL